MKKLFLAIVIGFLHFITPAYASDLTGEALALEAPAIYEGKRTAWLIDGETGELLSEFYAPTSGDAWKDTDRGLSSYRGGQFPTGECSWREYMDKADQM